MLQFPESPALTTIVQGWFVGTDPTVPNITKGVT